MAHLIGSPAKAERSTADLRKAESWEAQAALAHPRSSTAAFFRDAAKEIRAQWLREPDGSISGGWLDGPALDPTAMLANADELERQAAGITTRSLVGDLRAAAAELREKAWGL